MDEGALEEQRLSLRELCEGNLEGGGDPLLGTLEPWKGAHISGTYER